jgi:hypothetical protein
VVNPLTPTNEPMKPAKRAASCAQAQLSLLAHTAVQDQDDETNGSGWMRHGPVQAELPPPPIRKGVFTYRAGRSDGAQRLSCFVPRRRRVMRESGHLLSRCLQPRWSSFSCHHAQLTHHIGSWFTRAPMKHTIVEKNHRKRERERDISDWIPA